MSTSTQYQCEHIGYTPSARLDPCPECGALTYADVGDLYDFQPVSGENYSIILDRGVLLFSFIYTACSACDWNSAITSTSNLEPAEQEPRERPTP